MALPAFSPAADRNKQAILEVLRDALPDREGGQALEIASGTGQHVAWFAAGMPQWTWQPTDSRPEALDSIAAWASRQALENVRPPLLLDVMAPHWFQADIQASIQAKTQFDLIFCANMLHIAPWPTCAALMGGAARHLTPGGVLITYGPYLEDGVPTSEGNVAFDLSLRLQDTAWGIRRLEAVVQEAARAGLKLAARHSMPANNLLLVWAPA